jgi:hypothetical protein
VARARPGCGASIGLVAGVLLVALAAHRFVARTVEVTTPVTAPSAAP